MAYYLDLFSPLTYKAFLSSPRDITGFRPKQKNAASKLQPGDILICYLTKYPGGLARCKSAVKCLKTRPLALFQTKILL